MGTFVQRWTIEGSTDDDQCERYGADRMRVVLFDEGGEVQATEFASCKSSELSMLLRAKVYKGSATFINGGGEVVSATLPIDRFAIAVHEETAKTLDVSSAQMGSAAK
jgi:dihydrofolate reductase